jgi:hypothetical protein
MFGELKNKGDKMKVTLFELNQFIQDKFTEWNNQDIDLIFDVPAEIEQYFGDGLYGIYNEANNGVEVDITRIRVENAMGADMNMDMVKEFEKWRKERGKKVYVVLVKQEDAERFETMMLENEFEIQ